MIKLSKTEAIKLNCIDCIYDEDSSGGKIQQVACCKQFNCPLHQHRPVPKGYRLNGTVNEEACDQLRCRLWKTDQTIEENAVN